MAFDYIFAYFAAYSVIIPFVYCFLARKKKDKVIKTIWILLGIDLTVALISEVYAQAGKNTALYFNIYPLFQFTLVSAVYTYLIPQWKKWIAVLMVAYTAYFVINSLWIEDIRTMQGYPLFVQGIIVVLYGILHYVHIYKNTEREPSLLHYGPFWITTAFVSYFLYSLGLFFMANHILTELEPAAARTLWNIHAFNYIIKNILLTIGIRRIQKAENNEFNYALFKEEKNWRQQMPPNPNLGNSIKDKE